jgi:hypothetical protein
MGLIAMLAGELMGEAMRAAKRASREPGGLDRIRSVLERARHELRSVNGSTKGEEGKRG